MGFLPLNQPIDPTAISTTALMIRKCLRHFGLLAAQVIRQETILTVPLHCLMESWYGMTSHASKYYAPNFGLCTRNILVHKKKHSG